MLVSVLVQCSTCPPSIFKEKSGQLGRYSSGVEPDDNARVTSNNHRAGKGTKEHEGLELRLYIKQGRHE
jgi:hypothetical protein